jgi:hypothetical protein
VRPGQELARQAFDIEQIGVAHPGIQLAQHPANRAQGQIVARCTGRALIRGLIDHIVSPEPLLDPAHQVSAVAARFHQHGTRILGCRAIT